ncbi:hypothetical protein [Saccharopolyspora shandongensis]|uniref:hypothetical protein n=1 Tax=Saccharopolyspora shandongensis TaxID=418495 RepID=UPI00340A3829
MTAPTPNLLTALRSAADASTPPPETVATLPGDGWRVRTADGRDVSVIGFVVRIDGRTFPIIPTATGGIAVIGLRESFLYHPDDLPAAK